MTAADLPTGPEPRLGCSLAAHEALGWCGRCPGVDVYLECVAWQVRHVVGKPWTYEYAKQIGVIRR